MLSWLVMNVWDKLGREGMGRDGGGGGGGGGGEAW